MMSEEDPTLQHISNILSIIRYPEKWKYYNLEIDQQKLKYFFCEYYSAKITNKDTGEETYIIIKIVVPNTQNNGLIKNYEELYRNEINFYSKIFPELNRFQKEKKVRKMFDNIPHYIGGRMSDNRDFTVWENLNAAGFKLYEQKECYTSGFLKMILETFAKFHALSYAFKDQHPEKFQEITKHLIDGIEFLRREEFGKKMNKALEVAIQSFHPVKESNIIEKLKEFKYTHTPLESLKKYEGNYTCIAHGNYFFRNILARNDVESIDRNVVEIKMVNFQLTYLTSSIFDISTIFFSGASKLDMDRVDFYLEYYYKKFASFLKELGSDPNVIYPFKIFTEEWRRYSMFGIIIGIRSVIKKFLFENDVKELIEKSILLPKEAFAGLLDIRTAELRKRDDFKERVRDLCLHAVSYGLL